MEPNCVSINLGPLVKGKHKCELNNATGEKDLKSRQGFTYLAIENPCSSSPCLNNSTCQAGFTSKGFRCICLAGFIGATCACQKAPKSCKQLCDENKSRVSELVTLHFDSKRTSALCHFGDFGCGDGAWTSVMKINGNKRTFHYDSKFWSNRKAYNLAGGKTGFDTQETKLPSYWNTPFSKICLGMKIGQQINFIVINKQANSLYSLIADGQYRATSLGRNTWKTLIESEASLQLNCNREGFNAESGRSDLGKARIGILGNNENGCYSCDSRIGFGTGGKHDDSNTCGNEAMSSPDNGDKHIKAMGYILVQ
ncbi:putative skeletal organic matrix protein 5 [Oculina patagonica]